MLVASKPCKYCGTLGHYPSQCFKNPKRPTSFSSFKSRISALKPPPAFSFKQRPAKAKSPQPTKPINKLGKHAKLWIATRRQWFELHPAEHYECYLQIAPNCLGVMSREQTSLDHVQSRSRHPDKRYDLNNLRPSCYPCNSLKSSYDYDDDTGLLK